MPDKRKTKSERFLASAASRTRRQIIVLGMHRSGTSCVGNLLTRIGAYFGDPAISTRAAPENPKGFFERRDIREVCDIILQGSGCDWWSVNDFSAERVPAAVRAEANEKFARALEDLEAHRPWFIKEPRLCLTFPLLAQQLADPVFVLVWRRPLEVSQSLAVRNGFPIDFGLALWEAYVRAALATCRGRPTVVVSYNELVAEPHAHAARLVQSLSDLGVDGISLPAHAAVEEAVDRELHRNRGELDGIADLLMPSQQRLVEALVSGDPDHPAFSEPLSAAARLRMADWARREGLLLTLRRAASEVPRVTANAERLQSEIKGLKKQVASLEKQVADRRQESSEIERRHGEALADMMRNFERSRSEWDAERQQFLTVLERRDGELSEAKTALSQALKEHRRAAVDRRRESSEIELRHREALADLARNFERSRSEWDTERHQFLTVLDRRDGELSEAKAALSRALEQHRCALEAIDGLQESKQQWSAERARLAAEIAHGKHALREARAELERQRAAHQKAAANAEAKLTKQASALARRESHIASLRHDARLTNAWLEKLKLHLNTLEKRIEGEAAQRIERAEVGQAIEAARVMALKTGSGASLRSLFRGAAARPGERQGISVRLLALYVHYAARGRRGVGDLVAIATSGLFDADYYLQQYPDVAEAGLDPLLHYFDFGAAEGRNPSALFDTRYYLTSNPDVAESGINPLLHFIAHGCGEGRPPRPVKTLRLSPEAWKLPPAPSGGVKTQDSNPAMGHAAKIAIPAPIAERSARAEPTGTRLRQNTDADATLIRNSQLFDAAWYLAEYRDVAHKRVDPVSHYLHHGAAELRDPGPAFSTAWYLQKYADVRSSGLNPLVHYLRHGRKEGRLPAPRPGQEAWWNALVPAYGNRIINDGDESTSLPDVTAAIARMQGNPVPPAIIVPIYNAAEELEDCLRSLIQHSGRTCRIILIDDASPDARVGMILEGYAHTPSVEIHRNEANLGYTRTINKGIELAGRSDVILLNSDTKVTPGWIRNLRIAAYSGEKVGTATPFSNNAGAFSAPEIGQSNEIPAWLRLDEYGRAISQVSQRLYPSAPTGNGFCMYVRRDCIDETGLLDAEAFPRGYGEENDFCMRAGRLGWSHVVDDATLIWHARSASFGDAKSELMKQGRAVVDARYPEYTQAVRRFIADDRLRSARERVREAAKAVTLDKSTVRPRVLFVLSTRTGGTPQTNQDLMSTLEDRIEAFVLRCSSSVLTLMHFHDGIYVDMERHVLATPLRAFPHRSAEYDAVVADWLVRYAIELVHVRHIAWHGLGLIDVAKAIGLPVVFSFHDFYTVCPTVKLLDEANVYCGGKCTPTKGECRHELWREPDFPPLKHAAIADWRVQLGPALEKCDAFVTTLESAKTTLGNIYPFLMKRPFSVIIHGRDFEKFDQLAEPIKENSVVRILIPGNISPAKGLDVIADLARLSTQYNIELHVLGRVASKPVLPPTVIVHGAYARDEFIARVRAIRPHVGAVFSIWPETYCHTLTELWACGLPVTGFDFGAVGERIRETGAGWLAAEPTAIGVIDIVKRLRANSEEQLEKIAAVLAWQKDVAVRDNCQSMSRAYFNLYCSLVYG